MVGSHPSMSGLKREDEYRLKELTQLVEEKGRANLDEDQLLMLQLLEDRYNKFLDEGLRKLREAASPQSPRQSFRSLFSGGRGSPKTNAAPTGDSLDGSTLDLNRSDLTPLTPPLQASGKLWTWVLDQLVIGAVPFASQTTDTPGHLCELNEQCYQRRSRVAAVVSCLDVEEPVPAGFAQAKDWETQLSVNTFFHVACIPSGEGASGALTADQIAMDLSPSGPSKARASPPSEGNDTISEGIEEEEVTPLPSNPAFEEIISVCQNVAKLIGQETPAGIFKKEGGGGIKHRLSIVGGKPERRKIVFVHCKAGLARSWVFGMCYLMVQHHLPYDEADQYLRSLRGFMPKPCHVVFVRSFAAYITSPKYAAHTDEEEKYIRLLTEVLSMSPKYRIKLLQDLEKLT